MIFVKSEIEDIVQVNDKTRIDVSGCFANGETITKYEIRPDTLEDFYDVTSKQYLDWQYSTDGDKTLTVRITGSLSGEESIDFTLPVVSVENDNLFSSDSDLQALEDDILKYIRNGRNSFTDKHREAQRQILDELDSARLWKSDGTRYEASDIVDIQDFKKWSKFLTMSIICESLSNEVNDLWDIKSTKYESMAIKAKSRATLRLDSNSDGVIDEQDEKEDTYSNELVRR